MSNGLFRLSRVLDASRNRFAPASTLRIALDERQLTFHDTVGFEFALRGRCSVPASKVKQLFKYAARDLREEARSIAELSDQLNGALRTALEGNGSLLEQLQEMPLKVFTADHGWRAVFAALMAANGNPEPYSKVALAKYLEYLDARRAFAVELYQVKVGATPEAAELSDETRVDGIGVREKVVYDLAQVAPSHRLLNPFERLPHGQTVSFVPPRDGEVDLLLSRHQFKLVHREGQLFLRDDAGTETLLHAGRNTIGRHRGNQIVVDTAYRSVSRRHLVVDVEPNLGVKMTDLSSHGTFVPPQYLVSH